MGVSPLETGCEGPVGVFLSLLVGYKFWQGDMQIQAFILFSPFYSSATFWVSQPNLYEKQEMALLLYANVAALMLRGPFVFYAGGIIMTLDFCFLTFSSVDEEPKRSSLSSSTEPMDELQIP